LVGIRAGEITGSDKKKHPVDFALPSCGSVLFDALFIPGGESSIEALAKDAKAALFVNETYKHLKAIGAVGEGAELLRSSLKKAGLQLENKQLLSSKNGIVLDSKDGVNQTFVQEVAKHRCYTRPMADEIAV